VIIFKKHSLFLLLFVFLFIIAPLFTPLLAANGEFDMGQLRNEISDSTIVTTDSSVSVDLDSTQPSIAILILRVIGSLVVMGLMIVGVVWGIKKSGVVNSGTPLRKSSFDLMQSFATGSGTTIIMVRFEKSVLLLGQTNSNINLLKTIDGDEAQALIDEHQGNDTVAGFQKSLNSFISGMKTEKIEAKQ
jgi:flagellar biogenesis protein FliO